MENWKITEKDMEKARSYVPMAEKINFSHRVADKCRLAVKMGYSDAEQSGTLPDMFMENTEKKVRFLLGALVKLYLGGSFDGAEDEDLLLSQDDFDRAAQNHLLNQIERLKSEKNVRNKCFDLLQDYKLLEKMANAELYATLQVQNDPASRLIAFFQTATAPGSIRKLQDEAEKIKGEVAAYLKERETDHAEA